MTRVVRILLVAGAGAALAWILMAAAGWRVMPSYLAAWLFCIALPLGALPVLMLLELCGATEWPIAAPLRRLLLLQPVAALFAIPLLLRLAPLYGRAGAEPAAMPGWMATGFLGSRMIVLLLIWTGLCLLFRSPPRRQPRRGPAAVGLWLHLVIGTLAATDWVMSLDPGLASSGFGLMLISVQTSIALSAAVLVLALGSAGRPMPAEASPLLLGVLASWVFLQFIQFLIVWSANLPAEIVWYQHRTGGFGETALWFGFAAAVLASAMLLPHRLGRRPWILATAASMLLLAHLVELFWLVTPGFRGRFTLSWADLAAMIGLLAPATAFLLLVPSPATRTSMRHERV